MNIPVVNAESAAVERLGMCYSGEQCDWTRFHKPKKQMLNFATRYHLVYPALAYFLALKQNPSLKSGLRPQLDNIYRGLLEPRCWSYWHDELNEVTWPLQERNLTYAGRLATFVGFYIDAFGVPPSGRIELDGNTTTYSDLSCSLHNQMIASPNCGVSCYHHQSMVMCNAHMLLNNILHDRLFGTAFSKANGRWIETLAGDLVRHADDGPIFFYGTEPDSPKPIEKKKAVGADFWALSLMSPVIPEQTAAWFEIARRNVVETDSSAHVEVALWEAESEFSSNELASVWAFCLAKELGESEIAEKFHSFLAPKVLSGFELDPYISGVYLLGERLSKGAFKTLLHGS